ncbi:MAG: rhodanese-like domain-containing protein [Flavobacterium sp.]|nr:rhodanese-like domain-containing protein [Flavobacterium sp.]
MFDTLKNLFSSNGSNALKEVLVDAMLVDVRTKEEFSDGSVKGAVNIPLDQIQQQAAKFKGKKNIIVFCRSGMRSSQAKSILERMGVANVTNGGTWQNVQNQLNK